MKTETFKIVGITDTTILDAEGKVVFDAACEEHTGLEDHDRAKKITNLFAAAPELLEALQDIVDAQYSPDKTLANLNNAIAKARLVITKATQS
jgi:hypothetical protein